MAAGMDVAVEQGSQAVGAGVILVSMLTLFMAVVTGVGALPFFFMKVEAQVAGICNGVASGVMLAASFDLIQEGQKYGGGSWVVIGILIGGFFIFYCQRILENYEDVKLMELKGADARKTMLVIAIMFLHSLGEGAGVGVSYAGPQGVPQGMVVTLAIAVHNIPEGMAVCMVLTSRGVKPHRAMFWSIFTSLPQPAVAIPAFLCAQAFQKFLPLCMGFAAGCMVWMVLAEVLPESFREASHSQVASAATLSVACMEILSASVQDMQQLSGWNLSHAVKLALLFGIQHDLGGALLLTLCQALRFPRLLQCGIGCGMAFVLACWLPLQVFISGEKSWLSIAALLLLGILSYLLAARCILDSSITEAKERKKLQTGLISIQSPLRRSAVVACVCMALHVSIQGFLLGMASADSSASSTPGNVSWSFFYHSIAGGMVISCTLYGCNTSLGLTLLGTFLSGLVGSVAVSMAAFLPLAFWDLLQSFLVVVCGCLFATFGLSLLRQALGLDSKKIIAGACSGYVIAIVCLLTSKSFAPAL